MQVEGLKHYAHRSILYTGQISEESLETGEEAIVLTDTVLRKASQEEILRGQERARKWWLMDQRVLKRESIDESLQQGRFIQRPVLFSCAAN